MPTTFAHFSFGNEVLRKVSPEIENIISSHRDLFNIGLHGPDILFYFKALSSNPVKKQGHTIHSKDAKSFLLNAKSIINNKQEQNAEIAYISGFICHFMLDSQCHPYVRQIEKEGISHSEIETEFDRLLMEESGLDPLSYIPINHIEPKPAYAALIAQFYDGISPNEILRALKSMRFNLAMLVAPKAPKRALITTALRLSGNYEAMVGLLMKKEASEECLRSSKHLRTLYLKAIETTAHLLDDFVKNLSNSEPIDRRFERNFG